MYEYTHVKRMLCIIFDVVEQTAKIFKYLFCETVAIILIGSLDKIILNKHSFE